MLLQHTCTRQTDRQTGVHASVSSPALRVNAWIALFFAWSVTATCLCASRQVHAHAHTHRRAITAQEKSISNSSHLHLKFIFLKTCLQLCNKANSTMQFLSALRSFIYPGLQLLLPDRGLNSTFSSISCYMCHLHPVNICCFIFTPTLPAANLAVSSRPFE